MTSPLSASSVIALSSLEDFRNAAKGLHRQRVPRTLDRERTPMGKWVIAVRASLSQEAFAEALGVNRTTVADWERGDNFPEMPQVLKMIEKYPHAPELPGQRLRANATAESAAIAAMIVDLDERDRNEIKQVVRSMVVQLAKAKARKTSG